MKKIIHLLLISLFLLCSNAYAELNLELTQGIDSASPIAIVPFSVSGNPPTDVVQVISDDLSNSGRFRVLPSSDYKQQPTKPEDVQVKYWRTLGADNVVVGSINSLGGDQYRVTVSLVSAFSGEDANTKSPLLFTKSYTIKGRQLRALSHHISDLIYESVTGIKGVFSTRIAYVVVKIANRERRYLLEVADMDGHNPQVLVNSPEPLMSPTWSPDGRQIAYVSFENYRASIFIVNLATGQRKLLTSFRGINGAPDISPNGRELALVLSKEVNPNIYLMDLGSHSLKQLTNEWSAINTEPRFTKDGKSIIFTSNRGGSPQIYQMDLNGGNVKRLTYEGRYNARPSLSSDGKNLVVLQETDSGRFIIAKQDMSSGRMQQLTSGPSDESPCLAPNGQMVLYASRNREGGVLGMVSIDGKIQLRLPGRDGDVREPAWSPFLD